MLGMTGQGHEHVIDVSSSSEALNNHQQIYDKIQLHANQITPCKEASYSTQHVVAVLQLLTASSL